MPERSESDTINHPAHYAGNRIEAIEAIEDWGLGFHLGNVVKYVARCGRKPGVPYLDDLRKAQWYLSRAIERGIADSGGLDA